MFGSCFWLAVWFAAWLMAGAPDLHPWEPRFTVLVVAAVWAVARRARNVVVVKQQPPPEE